MTTITATKKIKRHLLNFISNWWLSSLKLLSKLPSEIARFQHLSALFTLLQVNRSKNTWTNTEVNSKSSVHQFFWINGRTDYPWQGCKLREAALKTRTVETELEVLFCLNINVCSISLTIGYSLFQLCFLDDDWK